MIRLRHKSDFDFQKFEGKVADIEEQKEGKYSDRRWRLRVVDPEDRKRLPHGMFWNKFSHSNVGRRVSQGVERWSSNRTDRRSPSSGLLLSPKVDRCRRVVAIRDDILLRLEQRMGTPRRPNVRKFHYAVQLVLEKPRLARQITRGTGIVSDYAIARITLRNSENFHFNIWLKYWV